MLVGEVSAGIGLGYRWGGGALGRRSSESGGCRVRVAAGGERRYTGALGTDFIIEEGALRPQQTLGLREIDTRLAIASLSHKGRPSIVTTGRLDPPARNWRRMRVRRRCYDTSEARRPLPPTNPAQLRTLFYSLKSNFYCCPFKALQTITTVKSR